MGTKTLTITNEAYARLASLKDGNESFSEVLTRLTAKYSLLDLVGILSIKDAEELKVKIKDLRTRARDEIDARVERLK